MRDPYNEVVRAYFANPVHAGHLGDEYNQAAVAEAGEPSSGARVLLTAVTNDGMVRLLRFRAYGCPHFIAAAEAICGQMEGKPVEALASPDLQSLLERLDIPVEKTGRLLILEDAIHTLHMVLTAE